MRTDALRLLAFLLVAGALGLFTARLAEQLRQPWSGAAAPAGVVLHVLPDSPAAAAGIRPGDTADATRALGAARPPLGVVAAFGLPAFVAGLVWLGTALLLLLRRSAEGARWLLFGGLLLGGAGWLLAAPSAWPDALADPDPLPAVLRATGGALLFHFCLGFIAADDDRVAPRIGALMGYFVTAAAWTATYARGGYALHAAVPLLLCAGLLTVARRDLGGFTRRRQASWLIAGFALSGLGELLAPPLAEPAAATSVAALLSIAAPLGIAAALFKVRLLEADRLLGGALLDLLLLVPVALATAGTLHATAGLPASQRALWGLAVAGAGLAVLLLVRRPLARVVGRRLGGADARAAGDLPSLADPLMRTADLDEGLTTLCREVAARLAVADVRYLLHHGGGELAVFDLEGPRVAPLRLRPQGRLLSFTSAFRAPVFAADLRAAALDEQELACLGALAGGETALLVPCPSGEELAGLLQIAPRRDGRAIGAASYAALAVLGERLGPVVDRLWEQARAARQIDAAARQGEAALRCTLAWVARDVGWRVRPALDLLYGSASRLPEAAADAAARLESLLGDLSAADAPLADTWFDACRWLDDVADQLTREAEVGQVSLEVRTPTAAVALRGDAAALGLALLLLAADALRVLADWTGPRHLTLALGTSPAGAVLRIDDTGPARRAEPEPPWHGPAGAPLRGLYLAVADRVVRQHGGRLDRHPGPDGLGLRVVIALPPERTR